MSRFPNGLVSSVNIYFFQLQEFNQREYEMTIQEWDHSHSQVLSGCHSECDGVVEREKKQKHHQQKILEGL